MELKRFFMFPFAFFPCGNAPQTNHSCISQDLLCMTMPLGEIYKPNLDFPPK